VAAVQSEEVIEMAQEIEEKLNHTMFMIQ